MILPDIGADPIDRFAAHPVAIAGGQMTAPRMPGASTELDWQRLAALATRTETLS